MARYTVKAPDGSTIELEGPEGAAQADVIAQAQRLYAERQAPKATPKTFEGARASYTKYGGAPAAAPGQEAPLVTPRPGTPIDSISKHLCAWCGPQLPAGGLRNAP